MMMRYLTEPEQRRLLQAAKCQACPLAQRDYHWMAALILTGMRITEFTHLTVQQVKLALATGWLVSKKEHCKGKRHANDYCVTQQLRLHLGALVQISEATAALLGEQRDLQPLVWGRNPAVGTGALSVRSYEARLSEWALAAGLDPRISPHWLRHTRGMNVMKRCRGNNAVKVAQMALNHTSLRSTGIYLQMSRETLARELQVVDGGGRMGKQAARRLAQGVAA